VSTLARNQESIDEGAPAPRAPRVLRRRAVDGAAALLLIGVLLLPGRFYAMAPAAFLRIPVEALAGVAVVLALPRRLARILVAVGAGLAGLLAVGRIADAAFTVVLARTFDPVFDAAFLGDAVEFVRTQVGGPGAVVAVVLAIVAVGAVVALPALAGVRLADVVNRHRGPAVRLLVALGAVWLGAALLGWPLAAGTTVSDAEARAVQIDAGLRDRAVFAAQTQRDAFAGIPGNQLLSALRGKDVVITFVESLGRSAIENPDLASQIDPALDADTSRLTAAGLTAHSGTAPSSAAIGSR
jgi:hypothetical protein